MFSSSKFSLKHTFKKASSLILGNQLSLYFFPFKWTHLCAVYVWGTLLALSFSLLPTEEKWKNVTTAGADSKAYEPSETRWALTASAHTDSQQRECCSSPFPLSAWIQISQDAQRKWTQHCLPKAHTVLWISSTAMVTLVLVTLNDGTGAHWHPDPQGFTGVSTLPTSSWLNLSCPCQCKQEDVRLGSGTDPSRINSCLTRVFSGLQTLIWGRDQFLPPLGIFSNLGTICISVPQNFKVCFLPYVKTPCYNEGLIYQNSKHYVNRN